MSNPFAARKPWAAALLTLIFGPFIGMLYLGRGRLALLYLALVLVGAAIVLMLLPPTIAGGFSPDTLTLLAFPVTLAGAVQAFFLARRRDASVPPRWYSRWYALLGFILFAPALAFGIRTFLYQPFNTVSASMAPALNPGDYVLATKFAYNSRAPARGDVVVFRVPVHGGVIYVKRIVGLPGEHIQVRHGLLVINGVAAAQRRVPLPCDDAPSCKNVQYDESLPGGRHILVLRQSESGELENTGTYTVPANSYFVLGDNRDDSDDSRASIGFVAGADITGRVERKYVENGRWTWKKVE